MQGVCVLDLWSRCSRHRGWTWFTTTCNKRWRQRWV